MVVKQTHRFAALLLNDPQVRAELANRGVVVPSDTCFIAAVHNTTTDALQWFDEATVPATHLYDLMQLKQVLMMQRCEIVANDHKTSVDFASSDDYEKSRLVGGPT